MRRAAVLALVFSLVALLAGCGGNPNTNNQAVSAFAGNYSGNYANSGNVNQGTITMTVGNDGFFSGTVTGTESGHLSGQLQVDGTITGGMLSNFGQPGQTVTGTLTLNAGVLTGPMTFTPSGGAGTTFNVNLPKQ